MAKDELYDGGESYGERKDSLVKSNLLVKRPLPRIDKCVLRVNKGGRPRKITPVKMKNAINRYFQWCEKNDSLPSIKGMMIHMKLYKDSFYRYIKDGRYTALLEHARLIIANWLDEDVYRTKGMAAGKVAYMNNIQDWAQKIDTRSEITNKTELSVGEARGLISQLAPELLKALNSATTVQQIGHVEDAEVIEEVNQKRV